MVGIGLLAMSVGVLVWFLPWDRWSPRSTLTLVPMAFLVIALVFVWRSFYAMRIESSAAPRSSPPPARVQVR